MSMAPLSVSTSSLSVPAPPYSIIQPGILGNLPSSRGICSFSDCTKRTLTVAALCERTMIMLTWWLSLYRVRMADKGRPVIISSSPSIDDDGQAQPQLHRIEASAPTLVVSMPFFIFIFFLLFLSIPDTPPATAITAQPLALAFSRAMRTALTHRASHIPVLADNGDFPNTNDNNNCNLDKNLPPLHLIRCRSHCRAHHSRGRCQCFLPLQRRSPVANVLPEPAVR